MRQQVTGIVAARFDPLMQIEIPDFAKPPNYEAFQAYSSGLSAFVDGDLDGGPSASGAGLGAGYHLYPGPPLGYFRYTRTWASWR